MTCASMRCNQVTAHGLSETYSFPEPPASRRRRKKATNTNVKIKRKPMLQEIKWILQEEGEPQCRWFSDHDLDLIVWQEDDDVVSFQLCYGKTRDEYALIWQSPNEYSHNRVDSGPAHPGRPKPAPALVPDEHSSIAHVVHDFQLKSTTIESELYEFIHDKLLKYEHTRKYSQAG